MAAEKIESLILFVTPYRETSCILRLFTKTRGLVDGIAKGVRGTSKKTFSPAILERGFLLDALLYYKPNRELHTLGNLHTAKFFSAIRSSIIRTVIRDVAIELYLKTITQPNEHIELFDLLHDFFESMNNLTKEQNPFPQLWRFIHKFCILNGFGINTTLCKSCGLDIRYNRANAMSAADDRYYLDINSGAFVCKECALKTNIRNSLHIGADVIRFMNETDNVFGGFLQRSEEVQITELLLHYVCRHFDIRTPWNSLEFIKG